MLKFLSLISILLALGSCSTAANMGDGAIRKATFNRLTATPFKDALDVGSCREALTKAFGYRHESLEVKNGVQITQTYKCKGERVHAEVNLKNRNAYPVYCSAMTDGSEIGTWVGPNGVAFYEYQFVNDVSQDCFQ